MRASHLQFCPFVAGRRLVLLRRDAVGLALVQSPTTGVNATTAAYIGVTGVDDLRDQCAARGARIVTGLADHPWGLRDFVVEMPGGHRLALSERITQLRLFRQEPGANRPNRSPIRARHRRPATRRHSHAEWRLFASGSKTHVALRDGFPVSLRPQLAEFTAAD